MTVRVFQKGFNFSQDGPGNRLVIHLQGCTLRCPWCSNPEGIDEAGGEEIQTAALAAEAAASAKLFFSGGGVTLTGGEPAMCFEAFAELLGELKKKGIHTAVETNAVQPRLPEAFGLIDYLMIDCKHYDSDTHERFTGSGNEAVLANIEAAARERQQLHIRIPLIKGFNASPDDARAFLKLFRRLGAEKADYEALKYHEYGRGKWEKLGLEYKVKDGFISKRAFDAFTKILADGGLRLIAT